MGGREGSIGDAKRRQRCQDQVIIFMALAAGSSKVLTGELTLHTRTAIHVAELLLPGRVNFTVKQLLPPLTPGWSPTAAAGDQQQKPLFLISCDGSSEAAASPGEPPAE